MFDEFKQAVQEIFEAARKEGRLIRNPDEAALRAMALEEPEVRQTKYGSLATVSEPMSRTAMFTTNNVDTEFGDGERRLLAQARKCMAAEPIVSIDCTVGDGSDAITARLGLPQPFTPLAS